MSRKGFKVLAVYLMAGALVLFSGAGMARAANVCGPVLVDTTWDMAGSPYIVTCAVRVKEEVTLTIEPGVEVKFDGAYALRVDGELVARGTDSYMITFTSNQKTPAPGDWGNIYFTNTSVDAVFDVDENYVSGSILEYCRIEYAGSTIGGVHVKYSAPFISHCTITDCSGTHGGIVTSYANVRIENCTISNNSANGSATWFSGGIRCYLSTVTISGNTISGNYSALHVGGILCYRSTVTITDNTISGNSTAASVGGIWCDRSTVTITGNTIENNSAGSNGGGIYCSYGTVTISGNTIANNSAANYGGGIYISTGSPVITGNSLLNNGDNSVYNNTANEIDATGNWWGTSNQAAIMDMIYDWYDNSAKGEVIFYPWLEGPANQVPVADSGGPYSGKVEDVINFDGSGSSDPDGGIVSWEWDFGDGTSPANGEAVTHAYDEPGSYTVTLTVTDNNGFTDTETATAEITCTDADDDGYYVQEVCDGPVDCDDSDDSIYPGAGESWDELDNDCDGVTDEGRYSPLDANRDGSVTPADALCVFRYYLGLPSCVD